MTLADAASFTKRGILTFIVLVFLGLLAFIGFKAYQAYKLAHTPPTIILPENKFGNLPAPDFPLSQVTSSNYSYTLDTTTGGLPQFEDLVKVYFMPPAAATLLAPDKSQQLAKNFGLDISPQILSETKYLFAKDQASLEVAIDTGNFIYQKQATTSALKSLEQDDRLTTGFKTFLQQIGVFKTELENGRKRVEYFKFDGDQIVPTDTKSQAQAALVFIWPEDIDKKPIVFSDFNKSLIGAVVINTGRLLIDYFNLNFTFWPVDLTSSSTYKSKTAQEAFNDLQSGKGVVVVQPTKPQVSVTSVYLAYYQSTTYTPYLQPVFVFEGPNFVAYVSAIKDQSTPQQQPAPAANPPTGSSNTPTP